MLCIIKDCTKCLRSGKCIDNIFLDFQKVFDSIPHDRLFNININNLWNNRKTRLPQEFVPHIRAPDLVFKLSTKGHPRVHDDLLWQCGKNSKLSQALLHTADKVVNKSEVKLGHYNGWNTTGKLISPPPPYIHNAHVVVVLVQC